MNAAISSDPHAWLRPIYARLAKHPAYRLFAPSHQFDQLLDVIAVEHPSRAAAMREWSPAAQVALVLHLASACEQNAPEESVELWRVRKAERELRCVVRYLPTGIDVRLLEGDGFRRTRLVKDAPAVDDLSRDWRQALIGRGWYDSTRTRPSHVQ